MPAPRLGDSQKQALRDRDINVDDAPGKPNYVYPSELLGPTAGVRLGSLLAYAAYAANYTGPYFTKLRSFRVPPFPERGDQASGVLALVGVAGDREPGKIEEFLHGCRASLQRSGGESLGEGSFDLLSGMPAAAAWQTVLATPGPLYADLYLPAFCVTRYALAALPGRLTVLVAVVEDDGSVDVQQFLFPLSPGERDLLKDPANVRKVDIALRAFAAGEDSPLAESDLKDLLAGLQIDPLLACVAGYSLIRDGEPKRLAKVLNKLTAAFPELPDLWVLAGLCDPKSSEDRFAQAVRRGVPLFAEGLRALGPRAELAGLLPGSVWSAWPVPRAALVRPDS